MRHVVLAVGIVALIAGCASTSLSERWVDAERARMAAVPVAPAPPGLTLVTDRGEVVYSPAIRAVFP